MKPAAITAASRRSQKMFRGHSDRGTLRFGPSCTAQDKNKEITRYFGVGVSGNGLHTITLLFLLLLPLLRQPQELLLLGYTHVTGEPEKRLQMLDTLRGLTAILFISRNTCSDRITKLCCACFYGVSHNCRAIRCKMGYHTDVPV